MRAPLAWVARWAAALSLLTVAGCGSGPQKDTVTIMIPWSGPEFTAFDQDVIRPFQADNPGIWVHFESTRAQGLQLNDAVASGSPPDLAVLPSVGEVDQYATHGRLRLRPLNIDPSEYAQPFQGLMQVNRKVYAVPVKADVKSLIWYNPRFTHLTRKHRVTLRALEVFSARKRTPWCLGLESGPTSGWPGADFIADILLARLAPSRYEDWLKGKLHWNAPGVKNAWTTWKKLVHGSLPRGVSVHFDAAAGKLATSHPTCSLAHGALAAMGFAAGHDYQFTQFSTRHVLQVSADFVGMFTTNPGAMKLLTYLSGETAQSRWVKAEGSDAFSADINVPLNDYRKGVRRNLAHLLWKGHNTLCFTAADTMMPDLSTAFYQAVIDYALGSLSLKKILNGLERIQEYVHPSQIPRGEICSPQPGSRSSSG